MMGPSGGGTAGVSLVLRRRQGRMASLLLVWTRRCAGFCGGGALYKMMVVTGEVVYVGDM